MHAEIVEANAESWHPHDLADAVLIDVPCSATGTIRRHPDIPHLRTADDVSRLAKSQERLLNRASALLAPGGTLVYASCSLQPEECEARIDAFIADAPAFQRAPVQAEEIGGLDEAVTEVGDLRTLPCHLGSQGGMDGFFAARLRHRG
jgi:16S rRNA (cytosine967-C5)-methyltransferase